MGSILYIQISFVVNAMFLIVYCYILITTSISKYQSHGINLNSHDLSIPTVLLTNSDNKSDVNIPL